MNHCANPQTLPTAFHNRPDGSGNRTVLLIHHDTMNLPRYRVSNYRYLYSYLRARGYELQVCADGPASYDSPGFPLEFTELGLAGLVRRVAAVKPKVCIMVVNHSVPYFFPFLLYLRLKGIKSITWTHGTNLQRNSRISSLVHHAEHQMCDGIILYAEHLKTYLLKRHHNKAFAANNTLNLTDYIERRQSKTSILENYGIYTASNVIFVGRLQRRKRIHDLLEAFQRLELDNCGLILVGPDEDGILKSELGTQQRVFALGPRYDAEVLDLLASADVCCIPGAIGLSIVDAMFSGLPVVTEKVAHGPEIMYMQEGENGFVVPKGDVQALADRLYLLLTDDQLRQRFSNRARQTIASQGHIDELCRGVIRCLDYVVSPENNVGDGRATRSA